VDISFLNIDEHTDQQIFDFVVDRLFKQGRPSAEHRGTEEKIICRYRIEVDSDNPTTLKCAIGQLIPNEYYREALSETYSIRQLYKSINQQEGPLSEERLQLLKSLQQAHDYAAATANQRGDFKERLIRQIKANGRLLLLWTDSHLNLED